jgi:hypothetical protein
MHKSLTAPNSQLRQRLTTYHENSSVCALNWPLPCDALPLLQTWTNRREEDGRRTLHSRKFRSVRNGNCVEVGQLTEPEIVVRNCTNAAGPVLHFTWDA